MGEYPSVNQVRKKHLEGNKFAYPGCAGLPFIAQMREIVFYVTACDALNAGHGVVCFCQPGEILPEIAAVGGDA